MKLIGDILYFFFSKILSFIIFSIIFILLIIAYHFAIFYTEKPITLETQATNILSNLSTETLNNSYIKSKGESCQKASEIGQEIDKQMQELIKQTNAGFYNLVLYFSWNSPVEQLQNSITQFNEAALSCNTLLTENSTKLRPTLIADVEKLKEESKKANESIKTYTLESKNLNEELEKHLKAEPSFYSVYAGYEWKNQRNQLQEKIEEKKAVLTALRVNENSRQQQIKNIDESLKNMHFQLPTVTNLTPPIPTFNTIWQIYLSNLYWLILLVLLGNSVNKLFWYYIIAKIATKNTNPIKVLREDERL